MMRIFVSGLFIMPCVDMKKTDEKSLQKNIRIYKSANYLCLFLFALLIIVWIYIYNKYSILNFLEEGQLFRTDKYYLQNYLVIPAGITKYLGAFFTQFYKSFVLGTFVLTFFILLLYFFQKIIYQKNGNPDRFFLLLFVVPVFFLLCCRDVMNIYLDNILAVVFVYVFFYLYLFSKGKFRYGFGILLYIPAYFILGGNALLLCLLMIIGELFEKKRSFFYIAGLIITVLLIPYFAFKLVYTTNLDTAYFALTPFSLKESNYFYLIGWLAVPGVYFLWRLLALKPSLLVKSNPWPVIIIYCILLFSFLFWGLRKMTDEESEYIFRMAYEVDRGNWDEVLELGKRRDMSNAVPIAYFSNIALSEKGRLASDLFQYRQTGTYGLFLTWRTHYTTTLYIGELYYRLGLIQEAEHCAFEALVTSPREHGSKALRRLVLTTMLRRDINGFEKYVGLLEKSPTYKAWAKEQRDHFDKYMNDSSYQIPGTPVPLKTNDFLIDYVKPPVDLIKILESDPKNKKVFEYLAMFFLLYQDMNVFYEMIDRFYPDMDYEEMPRYIQEGVLVSVYVLNDRDNAILSKYPVRKEIIERFTLHNNEYEQVKARRALNKLEERYGDAFYYYYLNKKPMLLETIYDMSVY